jgi:twitching motility protein PilT
MFAINELLAGAVAAQVSDVHLKLNQRPSFRLNGELVDTDFPELTETDLRDIVQAILPHHVAQEFEEEHEADFSYFIENVGRFRVNAFQAQGVPTLAFRYVKARIPGFAELNLPPNLSELALIQRGIVVITGTTGSGKSTTLAAMVQHLNLNDRRRIITIEDPVEYAFSDEKCLISQREVGLDTVSFQAALKHVMREDPDVIVIGEMRDELSFRTALMAAETGHLVLTTLHSGTAAVSIHRVLQLFPAVEREQARLSIAANMRAVICQRLIPATQGGVVPAVEIMVNTSTIKKLIENDRLEVLPAAIETGTEDGMQTFNQAVYKLIRAGTITQDEGMQHADNPAALRMNLQGIFLDEARRILSGV